MIIRKPYAFLIKNFKKIHIVLLILSLYISYRVVDINSFVNEFMKLGTYDLYADPVTNHISFIMMFLLLVIIVGTGALLMLLRHKNKPWKIYLVPLINYVAIFIILSIVKNFFKTYTIDVETTDLRFSRDFLFLFTIVQLPVIGIFIMRTFGLDISKFNFNSDEEFLQLSEEDREEIEISIDVDINTFKRLYRKFLRNIKYFYKEHELISKVVLGVIALIFLVNIYVVVFVTNRSYKEEDNYKYNGMVIKINNSYSTDKDYKGDVISKDSKFIIADITVENRNDNSIKFNTSNLHLKAGNLDYSTTESTYAKEFYDLGKTYSKVNEINSGASLRFITIYKVDKKIKNNRFVLYFQEMGEDNILRKIKLNVKDLSNIEKPEKYKLGDIISINLVGKEDEISIDSYELKDNFEYSLKKCTLGSCHAEPTNYVASAENDVLILDFASNVWESNDIVDFVKKCVKIEYMDADGIERELESTIALKKNYLGKYAYLLVPKEIEASKYINLHIIFRNKEYIYSLK